MVFTQSLARTRASRYYARANPYVLWEQGVASSNPAAPTNKINDLCRLSDLRVALIEPFSARFRYNEWLAVETAARSLAGLPRIRYLMDKPVDLRRERQYPHSRRWSV